MKIEKQVCSLELAQRLKELGVKQEGASFWWFRGKIRWQGSTSRTWESMITSGYLAAFTVAELGELLPTSFRLQKHDFGNGGQLDWFCESNYYGTPYEREHSMADVAAKMLIYLLENKLI